MNGLGQKMRKGTVFDQLQSVTFCTARLGGHKEGVGGWHPNLVNLGGYNPFLAQPLHPTRPYPSSN